MRSSKRPARNVRAVAAGRESSTKPRRSAMELLELRLALSASSAGSMSGPDKTKLDATDANTTSAIVQGDPSGSFSDGTITATLSGSADSLTGSISESQVSGITTDLAAKLVQADILRYSANNTVTAYTQSGSDVARGASLRAALRGARFGDVISLKAGTFDVGSKSNLNIPAGVTLKGAGWQLTKITCGTSDTSSSVYNLGNNTVVDGIWFEQSRTDGAYQLGIGPGNATGVTCYIRNCKITGQSDGLYSWTETATIYVDNTIISATYDAVAGLGSRSTDQTFILTNCDITADSTNTTVSDAGGGDAGTGTNHSANCINMANGVVQAYNCRLTANGKPTTNFARCVSTVAGAIIEIRDCVCSASGAVTNYDLQNISGIIRVSGGTGSGPGGAYLTYGTIIFEAGTLLGSAGPGGAVVSPLTVPPTSTDAQATKQPYAAPSPVALRGGSAPTDDRLSPDLTWSGPDDHLASLDEDAVDSALASLD